MIEKQGVLKAYSGRSMERTIGRYKKLINSRVNAGANAGNVLERFSVFGYVNSLNIDIKKSLNLLGPRHYTENSYLSLPSNPAVGPQLWSPMSSVTLSTFSSFISSSPFSTALQKFIQRIHSRSDPSSSSNNTMAKKLFGTNLLLQKLNKKKLQYDQFSTMERSKFNIKNTLL